MASAKDVSLKLQKMVNEANREGFKFNREEAATARTWQTNMSNTSHQREVKDLIKAGLNPVLSVNQGAQSYTTSAAQAQAQNAASAVAGLYESEWSAQATKKAARMSAAATRDAAAASAAATRYAADANLAAAKYQSDMNYKTQKKVAKINQQTSNYAIDNQKTGTWAGIVDKYLTRSGSSNKVIAALQDQFTRLTTFQPKSFGTPAYKGAINSFLNSLGVPQTTANKNLAKRAARGSKASMIKLAKKSKYH